MRKNLFVKVSGDLCTSPKFLDYLRSVVNEYFTVICVGGGSQINQALEEKRVSVDTHGPMGRELKSFELKQLARDILERNQAQLQDKLAVENINAVVIIPVVDIGSVLCHVNGDQMVRSAYLGFDKLVIITTPERVPMKSTNFADLPKIEIVGV